MIGGICRVSCRTPSSREQLLVPYFKGEEGTVAMPPLSHHELQWLPVQHIGQIEPADQPGGALSRTFHPIMSTIHNEKSVHD